MTSTNDDTRYDRQGDAVRRTYADFALGPEQRERHKRRLRTAESRSRASRISFIPAELAAIAAVALLVLISIAVWQSLEPRSDGATGTTDTATPVQSGPDAAAAERAAAMPFPPPETCPANAWAGPENRLGGHYPDSLSAPDGWIHSYFLDGSGIALNARLGLLYEGENTVFWLTRTYQPQDTTYSAERLDGDSAPATFSFDERFTASTGVSGENRTVRSATIDFPEPGCWQLTVASQDAGLRQIVYVYPMDERQP